MARTAWLSADGETTVIDDQAKDLESFVDAMADGVIDDKELSSQEARLVELMKKIEPKIEDDGLHADITKLLVELSAFNVMQMMHELCSVRSTASWRP